MAPAYWVGRPFGFLAAVYAVRTASLLLGLLSIPLAWMLARRLFPSRPSAWLLAPVLLTAISGFNASTAFVSNDALVVTASATACVAFLWALEQLSVKRAAVAGLLFGVAVVNKTTTVSLVPFLGLAFLLWAVRPWQ